MKSRATIPFPSVPGTDARHSKPGAAGDALGEFSLEPAPSGPGIAAVLSTRWADRFPSRAPWVLGALIFLVVVQVPIVLLWTTQVRGSGPAPSTGTVAVETEPAGLEVRVDGKVVGTAPLQIALPPGQRTIEIQNGDAVRSFPVIVAAGETVRQRFEFVSPAPGATASTTGTLQVTTEPSSVAVVVDGVARGLSPISVSDLPAGDHTLAVRFAAGAVERRVQVQAGATASVQIAMPSLPGSVSGWVSVDVPVALRISEGGRFVGTTDIDRIMLPVGEHVLDIGSDELGFRTQQTIKVTPGATTTVRVDLPRAPLSINARPWAEAWIDGERAGETPIGNLSTTIGRHDVVLRHPDLGERRESVLVTLNQPARLSVDLRQR